MKPVSPLSTSNSTQNPTEDLLRQQQLVEALCAPHFFPRIPRLEETHISWVLLTGHDAYKIKKAVDLGFLDFTTLEKRRFYCNEELRLNRRLAPDLYLDVVMIGGTPNAPILGNEPAVEYAVHMKRFAQTGIMNRLLPHGHIHNDHIDKLASLIAEFHNKLIPAEADSPHSATTEIDKAAMQNFDHLPQLIRESNDISLMETVRKATVATYTACEPLFKQRAAAGKIRECHGDLHLGNIVILDDRPIPFDCIEFSASLRWIDVISEISFTVMDLLRRGHSAFAWRLLNAYLENTGDYQGCRVLRFYLGYRAMVRAKIASIRAGQRGSRMRNELKSCRSYLRLAHNCLTSRHPAVIIMHGLPGCGKSTVAQFALERLGAIRIRSDVERKRMFGLSPLADSKAMIGDIYSEEITRKTYGRLEELAKEVIAAGLPVIIDAAFMLRAERKIFQSLANNFGVPFLIASVETDPALIEERLTIRSRQRSDASEADISVMQKLKDVQEILDEQERADVVKFSNNGDIESLRFADDDWSSLNARINSV